MAFEIAENIVLTQAITGHEYRVHQRGAICRLAVAKGMIVTQFSINCSWGGVRFVTGANCTVR
jgi:hypothetical protein